MASRPTETSAQNGTPGAGSISPPTARHKGGTPMAFIQIVEITTDDIDAVRKIEETWMAAT